MNSPVRKSGVDGSAICCLACVSIVVFAVAGCATPAQWPQWGGPNRDFRVESTDLADSWPEDGPKRLWSRPLGAGYTTIAVAGEKLLTMYRKGDADVVVAMHKDSGATIWEHTYPAPTLDKQDVQYGTGPNASPLIFSDRLITIGFTGKMYCLSLDTGKPIWSHDLAKEYGGKIQEFGYSSSPIIYDGNAVVLVGGEKNGVIAFNPADGSVAWKSGPHDISYSSPIIINVDGQDQLVFFSSTEIIGLNAKNGAPLWSHACINQYKNNAADPIWGDDNLLWVATQVDGATRVLKLSQKDGKTSVEQLWFNKKVRIFHWNSMRIGNYVYGSIGTSSMSMIAAIDVRTGEIAWRERGFAPARCVYADNKLIFLDQDGMLVLARVSPEKLQILAKAQMTDGISWTAPTLVGKTLYLRDTKTIMALDLGV